MTALLWVFIALQFADAFTTMKILARGGSELNPIMAWVFKNFGVMTGLFMVKAPIVAFFAYFLDLIQMWLMIVVCAVYAWVVYHNVKQLQK